MVPMMFQSDSDYTLLQLRLDYAWRWFSLHAKQRVAMFNYFLVASGILANAYGLLIREQLLGPAIAVASIGFIACLISIGLDIRNHQLVKLGEDVLYSIERNQLFQAIAESASAGSPEYGILQRDSHSDRACPWFKHKTLIRSLESVGLVGFVGAILYAVCQ